MNPRSFYNDENMFVDPNTSEHTRDIRTMADIMLRDFLIGFIDYLGEDSYVPKAKLAFNMITSREYCWDMYDGFSTSELTRVTIEQIEFDRDKLESIQHLYPYGSTAYIKSSISQRILSSKHLLNSYIAKFTLNNFIKCSVNLRNITVAHKFLRYVEKDFGIHRYFVSNDRDLEDSLEDKELDWLNVYVDYLHNGKNDKQLKNVLEKLEDYPDYIELKAKVIRHLNEYESEDIKL